MQPQRLSSAISCSIMWILASGRHTFLKRVLLAAAARHVELDLDVAGAEAEKASDQDRVHDDVVAALDDLEIERPVALGLARQR